MLASFAAHPRSTFHLRHVATNEHCESIPSYGSKAAFAALGTSAVMASAGTVGSALTSRHRWRVRLLRQSRVVAATGSTDVAPKPRAALVVGSGPAGLATAIMLAKRGWDVEVIERSKDPAAYDTGKGFMYLIDGRGQQCLSLLTDDLLQQLKDASVGMTTLELGIYTTKGLQKRESPIKDKDRESYWLPRHVLVQLLLAQTQKYSNITFRLDANITSMEKHEDKETSFRVEGVSKDVAFSCEGNLLIGADGYRSLVREQLEEWTGAEGRFVCKVFPSPAAGLRYKVLTLPSTFSLQTPSGEEDFASESIYAVRGAAPGRDPKLRLGLLPVAESVGLRTANLITYADNPVWEIKDKDALLEYARRQWPHFPIEELVSDEELERFASDEGGRFPAPQHAPAAAFKCGSGGAVILGDALHSFPPDIGQGVNSALEDVKILDEVLRSKESVAEAAEAFDALRMPDVRALVQMVRFGNPWQYGQNPRRGNLWFIGFAWRMLLSKLLPWVFDAPLFFNLQKTELSYREIWKREKRGTFRATAAFAALVAVSARAAVGALR